jgi:FtsH-binding integral membrane protein
MRSLPYRQPTTRLWRRLGDAGFRSGLYLTPFGYALFASPLMWVVALAPLVFVILLSWRIGRIKVRAARVLFWLFAANLFVSLLQLLGNR